jgi:hypothetical protein
MISFVTLITDFNAGPPDFLPKLKCCIQTAFAPALFNCAIKYKAFAVL